MQCSVRDANRIVREHERHIRYLASYFSRLGVCVKDLAQEGRIALFLRIPHFDPERGVKFWSYARSWVVASMQLYVQKQHALTAMLQYDFEVSDVSEEDDSRIAKDTTTPEDRVARSEQEALLREALAALQPVDRELLEQRFDGSERTIRQLAEARGVTVRAAFERLERAVSRMRAQLEVIQ